MGFREAAPGAMKIPQGAKDKERIQQLEARVATLERMLTTGAPAAPVTAATPNKAVLAARAAELGIAAPSTLARWSVEKLQAAIAEAEA